MKPDFTYVTPKGHRYCIYKQSDRATLRVLGPDRESLYIQSFPSVEEAIEYVCADWIGRMGFMVADPELGL